MRAWRRLRGYAGSWSLLALLAAGMVLVTAAAGPVSRYTEDRALREQVAAASTTARDITIFESIADHQSTATQIRDETQALLPPSLSEVRAAGWGIQRSRIERPSNTRPSQHVSLAGDGVETAPAGYLPLVSLFHQTDLATQVRLVDGVAPGNRPGGEVIEVMASAAVAEALGIRVGGVYQLLLGSAATLPVPPGEIAGTTVTIELTGVFNADDPASPTWRFGALLAPGTRHWPVGADNTAPLRHGTLVTDQAGIDQLLSSGLDGFFGFESIALFRLDEHRLSAGWLDDGGAEAVARLRTNPELRVSMDVQTGLSELFSEYARQAAAARAVAAVVIAGMIGTGLGLLVLAGQLLVDRRREEFALLRARGASVLALVRRLLAEAALLVLPATGLGWALHLLLPGGSGSRSDAAAPLVAAVLALLAVPAAAAYQQRARRRDPRAGSGGRPELRRPAALRRFTVELLVVGLAGLGVFLLQRRGLASVGTDPYLAAVPVLLALAAGLVALRIYPWPVRALRALAVRGRGVIGFLGLAGGSRTAPATAFPLLVLVLAVAVGGFATAVRASVDDAREQVARQAVGAHARLVAESFAAQTEAAVAELPGVTAVAALSREGLMRQAGSTDLNVTVLIVDTVAYQQVLAQLQWPARLPPELLVDRRQGPIPFLAAGPIEPGAQLAIVLDGTEHPVTPVGDVTGLPALHPGGSWALLPRQLLAQPPPAEELLIAGQAIDPAALAAAAGEQAGLTTLAGYREALAGRGFNRGISQVYAVGIATAALGGLLALGLSLAASAPGRGRRLSLLRTMGLSAGQARGLLLVEVTPLVAMAVTAGAVIGVATPGLLAPALGLAEFAGGAPVPTVLDAGTVGPLSVLLGVFVAASVLTEAMVNRRLGLGRVLRV